MACRPGPPTIVQHSSSTVDLLSAQKPRQFPDPLMSDVYDCNGLATKPSAENLTSMKLTSRQADTKDLSSSSKFSASCVLTLQSLLYRREAEKVDTREECCRRRPMNGLQAGPLTAFFLSLGNFFYLFGQLFIL